jgi:signal transduction histidine kinase/CheY-like chemotaxis protein/HPt (histidine-containing phosphotransfer) domain-containing protein
MMLAVAIVSAAGYLTYNSLSSIVSSINVKSRPDLRLLVIRSITADLDKAENSVRIYRLTKKQLDIEPYYTVISEIDDKIDSLKAASNDDSLLLSQLDTIAALIEENMLVWNEMIDLYHTDSLDTYVRKLTAKIAVGSLNNKVKEKSILRRVFSRKAIKAEEEAAKEEQDSVRQKILADLNLIEKQDSIKIFNMLVTETRLAKTGNEIRERLYLLISRMENDVIRSIHNNAKVADRLAQKTYQRLALFALLGTLLVLTVLFVVVRFVRKTREYEQALLNSKEETEKLAKTKELFVANMSHEIRTPVNAIHGFAEQLNHESLNEKSRSMLAIIRSTSEHLMQVVNDILDYSKLENASIELEKTHFLLHPVFEEIKLMFTANAASRNTTIFYTIGSNVPKALYGDVHRLKQILINLVGNSVKFTSNGEILLTAEVKDLTTATGTMIFTVADTGIGISKSMQDKVFEDFTQAEAGTSRKYGGTGLGLSIVRKLVELHNGEIKLISEEGKGTTISCIIPYTIGNQSRIAPAELILKIPDKIRNHKVLIVDDEDYNRMLFKTIFTRWKVSFDEAKDGFEAISKIRNSEFSLVFMDARMPGMDGLKAATIIRNELNSSSLTIIGTSATHSAEDSLLYHSAGINAFLPKPFTENMLLNVILSVMDNNGEIEHDAQPEKEMEDSRTGNTLDLTNLYHLANHDALFVKQLLTSFIESTESGLIGLQEAVDSNNIEAIGEIAHKISSPCKHVGAYSLFSRLKMIEEQARNNENIGILAKLSKECKGDFLEIKEGLQKHLETI